MNPYLQSTKQRGGRVAEGARLESVYTAMYRGFESLPLCTHRLVEKSASLFCFFGVAPRNGCKVTYFKQRALRANLAFSARPNQTYPNRNTSKQQQTIWDEKHHQDYLIHRYHRGVSPSIFNFILSYRYPFLPHLILPFLGRCALAANGIC